MPLLAQAQHTPDSLCNLAAPLRACRYSQKICHHHWFHAPGYDGWFSLLMRKRKRNWVCVGSFPKAFPDWQLAPIHLKRGLNWRWISGHVGPPKHGFSQSLVLCLWVPFKHQTDFLVSFLQLKRNCVQDNGCMYSHRGGSSRLPLLRLNKLSPVWRKSL